MSSRQALFDSTALTVFILILFGNYLGELLPCRVQKMMKNNIYLKHLLGFMTLMFFVVITMPELFAENVLLSSITLYIYFLFFSKTYYVFWLAIFFIFAAIFMISMVYKQRIEKGVHKKQENKEIYDYMRIGLVALIVLLTVIGFLVYLGNKKREYGKKFNFVNFLFGNPICKDTSPQIKSYIEEIKFAFK